MTTHTKGPKRTIETIGEGSFHVLEEGKPIASFKYEPDAREFAAAPELYEALADVELRCTQAKLASTIGKKQDRTEFLLGELKRISEQAQAALAKAKGI